MEMELENIPEEEVSVVYSAYSMDPSSIIPNEIWVKILSHLNQKELVRDRLVCSSWRSVIDEHFGFSVIVHDDKTDLRRVHELKVKDCLVTKVISDIHLLQYPELLRRVRFWGPVHRNTLHRILSKASNLEELSLTKFPLTQEGLFRKDEELNFNKLVKFEVLGYCCKEASWDVSNNMINLLNQSMPVLNRIFINISAAWEPMDAIVCSFYSFLARHREKITHVNASLIPSANGNEVISTIPTRIPESVKEQVYDGKLQLESLRLSVANKYVSDWVPLMRNQSKLTDLRVHWVYCCESQIHTNTGILCTLLYPPIIQSATTLVSVDLKEINLGMDSRRNTIPFDASIFRSAENLKRLILVRNKEDCQRNAESYGSPTIINFNLSLPFLEELEIVRLKCSSSDLVALLESSQNLKNVKLHHNGTALGQGVHYGIIEELTRKPVLKIINISPLNYVDAENNGRMEGLRIQFPGLCNTGDHVYFDFERQRQGIPQPNPRYAPQPSTSSAVPDTGHDSSDEDEDSHVMRFFYMADGSRWMEANRRQAAAAHNAIRRRWRMRRDTIYGRAAHRRSCSYQGMFVRSNSVDDVSQIQREPRGREVEVIDLEAPGPSPRPRSQSFSGRIN